MPRTLQHPFSRAGAPPRYALVYVLAVLVNFQAFLVSYSNSTYLERFTTPEAIGLLYTIGSVLSIATFLSMSCILRTTGNTAFTFITAVLVLLALLVMGIARESSVVMGAFVVFLVTSPLLYLSIDVFSEALIGENESGTGTKRGIALSLMSLAGALGPFLLFFIVGNDDANLTRTYLAAAAVGVMFTALVAIHFRRFTDPPYRDVPILPTLRSFLGSQRLRTAFFTHLALQVFFAWAIIYIPLYLATEIGLSWDILGTIIGLGLLAYVLFEWPIGYLADHHWGEKEMMALGFLIIILTLSWMSFVTIASAVVWAAIMFINRAGAALVEVTTESYFFKHTNGGDANYISIFRLTRPLGLLLGSLIGSVALLALPFNLIFVVFALTLVPAMLLTLTLKDTR
jgi:hypothetical protein